MRGVLLVGCGGFVGAGARYLCTLFLSRLDTRGFPFGTLLVNLLGCFLIGLLSQLLAVRCPENRSLSLFLTTGILGGFTTFSTFSLETWRLATSGNMLMAVCNLLISIAGGLLGVALGLSVGGVLG